MVKAMGQRGFSLIQTSVALGLISIMSFSAVNVATNLQREVQRLSAGARFQALTQDIQTILSVPSNCSLSLSGESINTVSAGAKTAISIHIPNLAGLKGKRIARVNETYQGLKINRLDIGTVGGGGDTWLAQLTVDASVDNGGIKFRPRQFYLSLNTSGAGAVKNIDSCRLHSTSGVNTLSGVAVSNDVITPLPGFAVEECSLIVSPGEPAKADGAKKRSRHYGASHTRTPAGWQVKTQYRFVANNVLYDVPNGKINYLMTCSK